MESFVGARRLPNQPSLDIVIRVYTSLASLHLSSKSYSKTQAAGCIQSFVKGLAKHPRFFHILDDDLDGSEAKEAICGT